MHTWNASGSAQTCAYLLEDGSALFPIQNSQCNSPHHDGAYPSGHFQKISWDGVITWDYRFCDATARAGYDVEPMPNGNILIPIDGPNVAKVLEVQPTGGTTGDIVWQCSLPAELVGGNTYMNAVSYNPELDMILVNMQEPVRTLVVINGGDRVAEFDWTTGTMSTISFAFQDHQGSVQRLPNGNTLVTRGGSTMIRELDDTGTIVASMTAPGMIQRAHRYGPTYGGLSELWPDGVAEQPLTATAPNVRFVYDRATETGKVLLADWEDAPIAVRVFSVNGRMVCGESAWGTMASFSTERLASGLYYVQVGYGGAAYRSRFLKLQ